MLYYVINTPLQVFGHVLESVNITNSWNNIIFTGKRHPKNAFPYSMEITVLNKH